MADNIGKISTIGGSGKTIRHAITNTAKTGDFVGYLKHMGLTYDKVPSISYRGYPIRLKIVGSKYYALFISPSGDYGAIMQQTAQLGEGAPSTQLYDYNPVIDIHKISDDKYVFVTTNYTAIVYVYYTSTGFKCDQSTVERSELTASSSNGNMVAIWSNNQIYLYKINSTNISKITSISSIAQTSYNTATNMIMTDTKIYQILFNRSTKNIQIYEYNYNTTSVTYVRTNTSNINFITYPNISELDIKFTSDTRMYKKIGDKLYMFARLSDDLGVVSCTVLVIDLNTLSIVQSDTFNPTEDGMSILYSGERRILENSEILYNNRPSSILSFDVLADGQYKICTICPGAGIIRPTTGKITSSNSTVIATVYLTAPSTVEYEISSDFILMDSEMYRLSYNDGTRSVFDSILSVDHEIDSMEDLLKRKYYMANCYMYKSASSMDFEKDLFIFNNMYTSGPDKFSSPQGIVGTVYGDGTADINIP